MMSFLPLLQTAGAPSASTGGSLITTLIPFALIIVIFYFFLIRPQNKKQKETQKMLDALKKGDKVITIGGIHGKVAEVKENTVVLKVDDGTKIEFNRSAVSSVELSDEEKAKLAAAAAEKKAAIEAKKAEKAAKKAAKKGVKVEEGPAATEAAPAAEATESTETKSE